MDDRRKNDRIDAHDEGIHVVNGIDDESLGIVGNLSPGGLMLIARRELHPDGILQLRIETPPEVGGSPIPLGVKILWCTPANSPEAFWAGLQTIDISEANRIALHALLDYLGQRQ